MNAAAVIRHLFISPGHNFFGRHGQTAGAHAAVDKPAVRVRAGWGIEGDRFFGYRPDYNGQITFFAWEVFLAARAALVVPALRPEVFRRNVLVEGIHLPDLIGARFTLGGIEFEGMGEAKPCHWMNAAVAPGAEEWLRGRGGLRAKVLSDGELAAGVTELCVGGLLALG